MITNIFKSEVVEKKIQFAKNEKIFLLILDKAQKSNYHSIDTPNSQGEKSK